MSDSLLERLESRHDNWKENQSTWKEIEDVLFDKVKNNIENYLPQGQDETPADYAMRKKFARFKGELLPIIHRLVGAATSRPPTREDAQVNRWEHFFENCDGSQTPLDQFIEDRLFEAFAFGASAVLVDRLPVDENGFYTETTSMGFEPTEFIRRVEDNEIYLVPYRISQIVDWSVDRKGEFHWVRLLEETTIQVDVESEPQKVDIYREFDRQSWRVFYVFYDGNDKRAVESAFGDHHLGIVPISIMALQKEKPMSFQSPLRYAYQHDISNFVADADLQYDQWKHAHPTIVDYTTKEESTRISVGPGARIHRNPSQEEDVKYLEMGGNTLDSLRESKREAIDGLRRISGIESLSHESTLNLSGRSRAMQFSISEERHLRRGSRAAARCERRIFEIAERWVDERRDISPEERLNEHSVTYPMIFMNSGTDALIEQWITTRSDINSETYDRQMQYKIVDSALGEIGAEIREAIMEEIKNNDLVGGAKANLEQMNAEQQRFEVDDDSFGDQIDEVDEMANREQREPRDAKNR